MPGFLRPLALLLALFLSLCAAAQDATPPEAISRGKARVQGLLRDRPENPALWFFLARYDALAGDAKACVADLEKVDKLGEGFLPSRNIGFAKVWDDAAFQAVLARLAARLPRLDYAATAFEVADRGLLPEGIAYDAPSNTFFLGSVAEHKIVRVDASEQVSDFASGAAGLDAVLGVAVDAPRRRLYAVSTSFVSEPAKKPYRNAIVEFDLVTGRMLHRFDVPQAVQLNDVAVAAGGRVYTTDSESGAVFEVPEKGEPRVVVPAGRVRGSNGLAASPDAHKLYVAHATGILVVDLATGSARPLAAPPRENVAAIDGLYQWQGMLIGVQNVTNPGRVIAMTLSRDGLAVERVKTLLSHHHAALEEPTTGAIAPDGFFLLARTGLDHLRDDGTVEDPANAPRPLVLRVLLPR
ncbi:MAG TPA: SMP-30/gluconolactonase/LRE family protein [Usitatibacter sp.]|nr:SMP-30/gluconolactonase/LRE family protein [Usitatibacter sp.]